MLVVKDYSDIQKTDFSLWNLLAYKILVWDTLLCPHDTLSSRISGWRCLQTSKRQGQEATNWEVSWSRQYLAAISPYICDFGLKISDNKVTRVSLGSGTVRVNICEVPKSGTRFCSCHTPSRLQNVIRTGGGGWRAAGEGMYLQEAFQDISKVDIINLNTHEQASCYFLGVFPPEQRSKGSEGLLSRLDVGTAVALVLWSDFSNLACPSAGPFCQSEGNS